MKEKDTLSVRRARNEDLPNIIGIAEEAFAHEYRGKSAISKRFFSEKITSGFDGLYVVLHGKEIVGYALYGPILLTGTFELYQIGIAKKFQNKGVGTFLIEKSIEDYTKRMKDIGIDVYSVYLTTSSDNPAGKRLYERCGFSESGCIKDAFVGIGNEEIVMLRLFSKKRYPKRKLWSKEI